jgi:hypothetical protein
VLAVLFFGSRLSAPQWHPNRKRPSFITGLKRLCENLGIHYREAVYALQPNVAALFAATLGRASFKMTDPIGVASLISKP